MTTAEGDGDEVGMIHREIDWAAKSPSTAVIEAVAETLDQPSTEIRPLYDAIDPEALDRLIRSPDGRELARNVSVTFTYLNFDIAVQSNGTLEIHQIS